MPKTKTPEELEQVAQEALAKASDARAAASQARLEEERRRAEAQRRFDEELVAGFSRRPLDEHVEQARARLDAELADNPLVQAFADWLHAEYRRRDAVVELVGALGRLGRQVDGAAVPPPPWFDSADTFIVRTAERIASTRAAAERDALATRRQNAGTAPRKDMP